MKHLFKNDVCVQCGSSRGQAQRFGSECLIGPGLIKVHEPKPKPCKPIQELGTTKPKEDYCPDWANPKQNIIKSWFGGILAELLVGAVVFVPLCLFYGFKDTGHK